MHVFYIKNIYDIIYIQILIVTLIYYKQILFLHF